MMRTLDRRLAALHAGTARPDDFILADAKDADMARGLATAGLRQAGTEGRGAAGFRSRQDYLDDMLQIVRQGEVDILLASASNGEALSERGVFAESGVTLAIRANDTTEIWLGRHAAYARAASRPFRTARLERVRPFCDLGLYSVTFNNDLEHDHATLTAYAAFRDEALRLGFRHFLEVFNPNAPSHLATEEVPAFVNDAIHRTLAGVTRAERPVFLKIAYNGARWLEELVSNDPGLVVGILGGSAGTNRDAYELLEQAARHGARVALFGRKIQAAEAPLELVALMRPVVRGELGAAEAVRAYHAALERKGLRPARPLAADLEITEPALRG
jgi:DhnA family fructose-bisphosphate aldolase class Ia